MRQSGAISQKEWFTLIELILIIVIVSILIGIAVRGYVNLKRNASDGAAKEVLGVLRSQNTLMYSQYVVRGSTASYTMRAIANNMSTGQRESVGRRQHRDLP
jgi:type II secretory pathway pseudopilin PulG